MAEGISYKVAGVWRSVSGIWYRTGGVWRDVQTVHYRVGGVWRLAYEKSIQVDIIADTANYNLSTDLQNNFGWNGTDVINVNCNIASGVQVYDTIGGASGYAFDTGTFPVGCTITITLADSTSYIVGNGGDGGNGVANGNGGNGQVGGNALRAQHAITVVNNGNIWGAGGGGGAGGGDSFTSSGGGDTGPTTTNRAGGGGGGGAGRNIGALGTGGTGGSAATLTTGGAGRLGDSGATGGSGGSPGNAGANGQDDVKPGGTGGLAGFYITGDNNVTWSVLGDRRGRLAT